MCGVSIESMSIADIHFHGTQWVHTVVRCQLFDSSKIIKTIFKSDEFHSNEVCVERVESSFK